MKLDSGVNIGQIVEMKTTHPLHYDNKIKTGPEKDDVAGSFAQMLMSAVNKVNNLQVDSEELAQRMIYAPDSVDIHTVMIAAQKAELALTFTKSIRDEAVRAYRELINIR